MLQNSVLSYCVISNSTPDLQSFKKDLTKNQQAIYTLSQGVKIGMIFRYAKG